MDPTESPSVSDVHSSSAFQKYQKITSSAPIAQPFAIPTPSAVLSHAIFPLFDPIGSCKTAPIRLISDECSPGEVASLRRPKNVSSSAAIKSKAVRDRRCRTTFTIEQTNLLEEEFNRNEYVSRVKRLQLASSLGLNEAKIKIWFQNRRAKHKRIEKAQTDHHYRCMAVYPTMMSNYATPGTKCGSS